MTLRYQSWRWFTRFAAVFAITAVAVLLIEPGRAFEIAAYVFIFAVGASGALIAILVRLGAVRFTYTEADRRSIEYRLSSRIRQIEDKR
jgi:hypothetical protein